MKVKLNEDELRKISADAGWMVAVSNCIKSSKNIMQIYRDKDVVENFYYMIHDFLDSGRMNFFCDQIKKNKLFILFISLILKHRVHKVMLDNNLYEVLTMKELFKTLEKHHILHIKGDNILLHANEIQKKIYSAFGLSPE